MIERTSTIAMKVLVVEDHPLLRSTLARLVTSDLGMIVCGETDNAHDAIRIAEECAPDMAIIDLSLKGTGGLDLIKDLRLRSMRFPILVISSQAEQVYAERVLRAGANGYISKLESPDEIIAAIRRVSEGEIHVSQEVNRRILGRLRKVDKPGRSSDMDLLSDREVEIFHLFGMGLNSREISTRIHLGISSVDSYRSRIREKLGIKNAAELYQRAARWIAEQEL